MHIIGHRGARGLFPENTYAGFVNAYNLGVNAFELDVVCTKDNTLVVHHDYYLNVDHTRFNNTNTFIESGILIKDITYDKLLEYNVGRLRPGSEDQKRFPNQAQDDYALIPRLTEILTFARERDCHLTIEIKVATDPNLTLRPGDYISLVNKALTETSSFSCITVSSFNSWVLHVFHEYLPFVRTSALTEGPVCKYDVEYAKEIGASVWSPDYCYLESHHVFEAQSDGLAVIPYTVNHDKDIIRLKNMGVDGIITDYPIQFLNY